MRIRFCRVWKATSCLLVSLWFCFSIMHLSLLRKGDRTVHQLDSLSLDFSSTDCENATSTRTRIPSAQTISQNSPVVLTTWLPGKDYLQQQYLWKQMRDELSEWQTEAVTRCSKHVVSLPAAGSARVSRVIFDPSRASGKLGGEDINEVLNQPESTEYWALRRGAFGSLCPNTSTGIGLGGIVGPLMGRKPHTTFRQYLAATIALDQDQFARLSAKAELLPGPVLAVVRHEYANLYHTVAHLYNAFANAIFYGFDPAKAVALIIDGHPRGALDTLWTTLFRRVVRIGQLKGVHLIEDLVFVSEGHESPMLTSQPSLPLMNHFRQFFLSQHDVPIDLSLTGSCTGSQVVIIWRRDYLAHPRNPRGHVARKIANEAQILAEARRVLPHLKLNVTGIVMESLTPREQLSLITSTRVLIGMHGAGLTHALFLPTGAGLIELFPDHWTQENFHFRSIAAWRSLSYEQWVSGLGNGDYPITVPEGIISNLMHSLLRKMGC